MVRDALREAVAGMKSGVAFDDSPTGFCMLGRLERGIEAGRFIAECERRGVLLTYGADYWMNAMQGADSFRIGFGSLTAEEVPVVIGLMEAALMAASSRSGDRSLL